MFPTEIPDMPFPLITGGFTPAVGQSSDPVTADSGAITPETNVNVKFPVANVAQETLSQSLNTETKRILGAYTFEQLGALSIGAFSQGVSGEIKISPDGVVAKNINGDETFTLDGATGDATFSGTVKAGDVEVINDGGLVSLASFSSRSINNESLGYTPPSAVNFTNVTGISLALSLTRSTNVLIGFSAALNSPNLASLAGTVGATLGISVDGVDQGSHYQAQFFFLINDATTHFQVAPTLQRNILLTLAAGNHTLQLRAKGDGGTSSLTRADMFYVTLGS